MEKRLFTLLFCLGFLFSCKKNETGMVSPSVSTSPANSVAISSIKTCAAARILPKSRGGSTSGAGVTGSFWPNNTKGVTVLRVKFVDNFASAFIRSKIQYYAKVWETYANVRFDFVGSNESAEIRVACAPGGSWSYVGNESLNIPEKYATMNYGWLTDATSEDEFSRVITHEFGHAIGLWHEQSSPMSNIQWNKPVVYDYYANTSGWSKDEVDQNVFYKLPTDGVTFSPYDPASIMHYPVPKEFTLNGFMIGWNRELSAIDKTFIQTMYPFPGSNPGGEQSLYIIDGFVGYLYGSLVTNQLTVKRDAQGNIIAEVKYPGYMFDSYWKNDQYVIRDASGARYLFSSRTTFNSVRNGTGLKGSISIFKNGQQVFSN